MPEDIYLRFEDLNEKAIPGLKGECMDSKHKGEDGWIQFKSLSFGFGFGKNGGSAAKSPAPGGKDVQAQIDALRAQHQAIQSQLASHKTAGAKGDQGWGHSGALDFDKIRLSKNSDATSYRLMEMCHGGEMIPRVVVEACRSGGLDNAEKVPFLILTFETVFLKSCKLNLATDGLPSEDFEFEFDVVRMKSLWTDNSTGAERASKPIEAGWDLTKQQQPS